MTTTTFNVNRTIYHSVCTLLRRTLHKQSICMPDLDCALPLSIVIRTLLRRSLQALSLHADLDCAFLFVCVCVRVCTKPAHRSSCMHPARRCFRSSCPHVQTAQTMPCTHVLCACEFARSLRTVALVCILRAVALGVHVRTCRPHKRCRVHMFAAYLVSRFSLHARLGTGVSICSRACVWVCVEPASQCSAGEFLCGQPTNALPLHMFACYLDSQHNKPPITFTSGAPS